MRALVPPIGQSWGRWAHRHALMWSRAYCTRRCARRASQSSQRPIFEQRHSLIPRLHAGAMDTHTRFLKPTIRGNPRARQGVQGFELGRVDRGWLLGISSKKREKSRFERSAISLHRTLATPGLRTLLGILLEASLDLSYDRRRRVGRRWRRAKVCNLREFHDSYGGGSKIGKDVFTAQKRLWCTSGVLVECVGSAPAVIQGPRFF